MERGKFAFVKIWVGLWVAPFVRGAVSDIDIANFQSGPKTGYKIIGPSASAQLGYYMHGAGDFNGDGLYDLFVPALQAAYSGRSNCGISYIIFGSTSFPTTALDLASFTSGSAGVRIFGAATSDYSGNFGGGGGDINNDGYDDVLIGARLADPDGVGDAGTVTVIFGHSSATAFTDIDLASLSASAGARIRGVAPGDWTYVCSFVGDMNGDGFDDIILAAQLASPVLNREGTGYVIFGKSSFTNIDLSTYTLGTTQGFRFRGNGNNHQLGQFVGTAGDFNGDGYADAVISSYRNGYAYVLFGHNAATNFPNIDQASWVTSNTVGFKVTSQGARPYSTAGDVNGDGIDDLIILGDDGTGYGTTSVLYGHRTGSFPDVTFPADLTTSTGFQIIGATALDGSQTIIGGDFNSDGRLDFLSYSPGGDPSGRSNAGLAHVIFGKSPPYSNVALSSFTTSDTNGYKILGAVAGDGGNVFPQIARLGDVNGDGVDDIAYCASNADASGRADAGVAYIILSTSMVPTSQPSAQPAGRPSDQPSSQPSRQPSHQPNSRPTGQPSCHPSAAPSSQPSSQPSVIPSIQPNAHPSAHPSHQPTALPSAQPFSFPSSQPSAQPNVPPTLQPSVDRAALDLIVASPTYHVKNGFAFAVLTSSGYVQTWGEAANGGNSSRVVGHLSGGVQEVVPSRFGYAAVTANGSLALWGVESLFEGLHHTTSATYQLANVVANEAAFAAADSATGRVVAIGSKHHGGNVLDDRYCNGYSVQLSAGVRRITASAGAFAAIKIDGTAYGWGNPHTGGNVPHDSLTALGGVKRIVATRAAFAALLVTGEVAAWGDRQNGGDTSAVATALHGVHHIVASRTCFVAFKKDSSAVVWGNRKYGGDTSSVAAFLTSQVTFVAHTFGAMAAVKSDGTVAAWGARDRGGDAAAVQASLQDVVRVVGNSRAFAALTTSGGVVAWGHAVYGGGIPANKAAALFSGVVSIQHTDRAFAALKSDGSVLAWGQEGHGGEPGAAVEALLTSGVHTVCGNDVAFSAIKTDGSVVAWGHIVSVPAEGVQFTSASLTQVATCA